MVEPYIADNAISASDALLLVEVLSPSTMHIDFHKKLEEYKGLSGLKELGRMRRMYLRASMPPSKCPSSELRCRLPTSTATSPSGMGDRTEVLAGGLGMSASKYLQVALLPIFQQQPIASEEAKSLFPGRRRENAIRGIARRRARKKGG
jgi:hypothetical protein